MKNVFLYCWVSVVLPTLFFGQGLVDPNLQNAHWVFGAVGANSSYNDLDFNDNTVTRRILTLPTPFISNEGCATVSNRLGELILISDGQRIFYLDGALYRDITGVVLRGNTSSAQNVIFIPKPNSPNVFYIVTIDGYTSSLSPGEGLYYSEIDYNGGTPIMNPITTNVPLTDASFTPANDIDAAYQNLSEAVTSTVRVNILGQPDSYWLLVHVKTATDFGKIIAYSVTASGINYERETPMPLSAAIDDIGLVLKISPDRSRFAMSSTHSGIFYGDFDDVTGAFSNVNTILANGSNNINSYGVEFSPDSRIIYFTGNGNRLSRMEIASNTIQSASISTTSFVGNLQLGLDGNIYLARGNNNLVRILNPNDFNSPFINSGSFDAQLLFRSAYLGLPQWVHKDCDRFLIDDFDIQANALVTESRWDYMKLTNSIRSNATAIYHAGNYIELLPENGTNLGFEAEFGSEFSAYIAACNEPFVYKQSTAISTNTQSEKSMVKRITPKIELHPNPVNNLLHIDAIGMNITEIQINSIEGKRIQTLKANSNQETIDVSNFSNGMYLVIIQTEDGQTHKKKFVKN